MFYVQCSFSMGCITTTLCNQNPINTPTTKIKIIGYILLYLEPQLKIQLTQTSYKVTSFLDFQPFLQGFQSVAEYLNDLLANIDDPAYYQRLISPFGHIQVTPLSNDTCKKKFLNSPACSFYPYACEAKMKFEQYQIEIQYVYKVFHAIYKKILDCNRPYQFLSITTTLCKCYKSKEK